MKTYAKIFYSLSALIFLTFFACSKAFGYRTFVLQGVDYNGFVYRNVETGYDVVISAEKYILQPAEKLKILHVGDEERIDHYWLRHGMAKLRPTMGTVAEKGMQRMAHRLGLGFWAVGFKRTKNKNYRAKPASAKAQGVIIDFTPPLPKQLKLESHKDGYLNFTEVGTTKIVKAKDDSLIVDYSRVRKVLWPSRQDLRLSLIQQGSVGLKLPARASKIELQADLSAKANHAGMWQFFNNRDRVSPYIIQPRIKAPSTPGKETNSGFWESCKAQLSEFKKWYRKMNDHDFQMLGMIINFISSIITAIITFYVTERLSRKKKPALG